VNLPIGLVAILAIIFLIPRAPYKPVDPAMRAHAESRAYMFFRLRKIKSELLIKLFCLDYVGTFTVLAFVIMLTMALQWGGVEHPWSSATIIGLLVGALSTLVIFIAWMIYTKDSFPLFTIGLLRNRSVAGACVFAFGCSFVLQAGANYIPLYWQVTRHRSAVESGLDLLPFVLGITGCAVMSGFIVSKTGSYAPWILISPALTAVGSGLLYRSDAHTAAPQIKGFTFLMAAGIGVSKHRP
jgi:hypothetical protein